MDKQATTYDVIDRQTGDVIATVTTRNKARRIADRKDAEYGAYRYMVRPTVGAEYISQE